MAIKNYTIIIKKVIKKMSKYSPAAQFEFTGLLSVLIKKSRYFKFIKEYIKKCSKEERSYGFCFFISGSFRWDSNELS